MDDPNIIMEEYIRLEEEKARKHGKVFNWETAKYGKICFADMALPPRVQRHQHLRYEGLQYTNADIVDFKTKDVDGAQGCSEVIGWRCTGCKEEVVCHTLNWITGHGFSIVLSYESSEALLGGVRHLRRYLRLFAAGRKSGANISGGQFVARLAEHFGFLTMEILQGLTVIAHALSVIDMVELPNAAVGTPEAAENAPVVDEGGQAIPTLIQAPQPPPPPAAARTMPQRLRRLEEEMQGLRRDVVSLRGLVERSITNQGPSERNIDEYWWRIYKSGDLEVLES
ncbi:hypothetical protein Tco_0603067 [Tanacetum coccineum]